LGTCVYLEAGTKRTFAAAKDWPGWCRSGRDEASALAALVSFGPRYAQVLRTARLGFRAPADVTTLSVSTRLKGNATTDFGAPGMALPSDADAITDAELRRLGVILGACWRSFDKAVKAARGRTLRKGLRGGGRDLKEMVQHVLEAQAAYMRALGSRYQPSEKGSAPDEIGRIRRAVLDELAGTALAKRPTKGPRGGVRWSPRYFARRSAWHILDHAWEIEDRII
jgi:hypothetical protein